jgi:hypothetical protein
MSHDTNGKPYLKFSEGNQGVVVIVDSGFDCMEPWSEKIIKFDKELFEDSKNWNTEYKLTKEDCLYIDCICTEDCNEDEKQKHYIDGQFEMKVENGEIVEYYIGLYLKSSFTEKELVALRLKDLRK